MKQIENPIIETKELSQPKPEALQTTLKRLRHLHGKDSQQLSNIAQHLRGLRNSPKHCPRGQKKLTNSETRCKTRDSPRSISPRTKTSSNEDSESDPSAIRQIFDRFAGHLFEHLERKRALENYEASKLMMPVEIGYYSAAYDALVQAFGHPYHKCTLELYQQLAAELGLEAEITAMYLRPA
uniref:Uncharacterized protein n=1 Tax=Anopheles farauti TaxID=69004 RepID=A0A182QWC7_9DIPT